MTHRLVNFSAGPAVLPESVLMEAQNNLFNYKGVGMSVMEMSHRSEAYDRIHSEALADLRTLLAIPSDYTVLFLQGGASQQFALLPMNLANNRSVDVIHSGVWTKKAIDELKKGYSHRIVASNESQKHLSLPSFEGIDFDATAAYTYMCSNNTLFGTQFHHFPNPPSPLVVDMSSDILCRPLTVRDFGVIFAGAQKNIGPAGLTIVIIRNDLLDRCPSTIPTILNYQSHAAAESLYNTPPTFAIYIAGLVFKQLLANGGLSVQAETNRKKADCLYDAIDSSPVFYCPIPSTDRSLMNVVFRHVDHDESVESAFIATAKKAGFDGLKGHRSVGGLRASIYNAQSLDNCTRFAKFITEFVPSHAH